MVFSEVADWAVVVCEAVQSVGVQTPEAAAVVDIFLLIVNVYHTMTQDSVDRTKPEREEPVAALGPADAVLFDTLDARLTDLEFYTTPDGTLLATAPDTSSAVRLTVTDRGLAATEIAQDHAEEDRTPVEHVDPAPEPDVTADADLRTRLRGD